MPKEQKLGLPLEPPVEEEVPVATVAWEDAPNGGVAVGVSLCSPSDTFSKARGRLVASNRLECPRSCRTFPNLEYLKGAPITALLDHCPRWAKHICI